ncbi:MAG: hypothetical protein AB2654_11220 [Candidatus Thiodiazotropha sp.]
MNNFMVLRFRDLVTGTGETILEHRSIIENYGHTWWGWWKRPYEQIPINLFEKLRNLLPVDIYLLDTGWKNDGFHMYKARLIDIADTQTGSELQSPEPEYTPGYYNKNWLHVWFKINKLEKEPDMTIRKLSLASLPSWPEEKQDDIGDYLGSTITTQEDLRRIDVTLWLVGIESSDT